MFGKLGSSTFQQDVDKIVDQESLKKSVDKIINLVYSELEEFEDQDPSRIFIGGFSQGGSVSLAVLFRIYKDLSNLGGVISVTGPLPLSQENFLVPKGRLAIPILMVAGQKDTITDL